MKTAAAASLLVRRIYHYWGYGGLNPIIISKICDFPGRIHSQQVKIEKISERSALTKRQDKSWNAGSVCFGTAATGRQFLRDDSPGGSE
jgi:hypothetical protein